MFMPATAFTPIRPRPLTDIEFCAWIGQAVPGDRLEYHRGFLGIDTTAVRRGSTLRATTVCSAMTRLAAATTGSTSR